MTANLFRRIGNILGLAAVLVVNWAANAVPLAGRTTGQVAERFPVLIQPASYAFGIWSVIYLGLVAFVVYQALPSQRENPRLRRLGYAFVVNAGCNIAWLIMWHHLLVGWSVLAMLGLLGSLIVIYHRLEIGRAPVSIGELFTTHLPFQLYFGWIVVASVVNLTVGVYLIGFPSWRAEVIWTVSLMLLVAAIGLGLLLRRGDVPFNLVVIWALVAIALASAQASAVSTAAIVAATVLGATMVAVAWRRGIGPRQE